MGGGQTLYVNGYPLPRDVVFRFLPVTLPLASLRVTSLYGMRPNPFGGGRTEFHPGVDFGAPMGTPVHSTAAGKVTYIGDRGAYGMMVEVTHGLGFRTRYSHLSSVSVNLGQVVDRHAMVGGVGGLPGTPGAGRSTGPHLYFEIWFQETRFDPILFILKAYETYHHLD